MDKKVNYLWWITPLVNDVKKNWAIYLIYSVVCIVVDVIFGRTISQGLIGILVIYKWVKSRSNK